MNAQPKHHESPRDGAGCIAPIGETDDDETLCGEPATTTRIVADLVCPLCEEHAQEIDEEPKDEEPTG